MASLVYAVLCALIATAFWTLLGYALARHLLPRVLALGAAAVIGWAAHSAVTLPVYDWIGFSPITVVAIGALCILVSGFSLSLPAPGSDAESALTVPAWALAAAAILALVPAAAILPKFAGDAVQLADPIFDHAKSAMIDAMARLGLPPVNPVFGEFGAPERLAYYYLWHFSAAEVALTLGTSGWEADIGLTWFTAFASLSLMMGLAVWLCKRSAAAIWGRGARDRGLAVGAVRLAGPRRRSRALVLAAGRHGRLAVSGRMGAPASDGGILRRDGDAAADALRAAAEPDAYLDAGFGHRRRFRKLDLCRRRDVRDCRSHRGADPARRDRPGAAPAFHGWFGARRIARRLPHCAIRARSIGDRESARRRRPDRRFTL
jgi:hypothetical protein